MFKINQYPENNKDYQTSFKLIYYGDALDNHEMPAAELSSIIKAMNDLFVEANAILNNGQAKIDVNVKANFEKGSFGIDFTVMVCMFDTVKNLLTSDYINAVLNAYDIKNIIRNLMKFIKERKGKLVSEKQIIYEDDKLYIPYDDKMEFEFEETNEKEEIINGDIITRKEKSKKMIKLNNNNDIRKKIEGITNILESKGVEELKLVDKYSTKNIADKNNVKYFKAPNQVSPDLYNNYTIETLLKIKKLTFDENSKWTLYSDGETSTINATIEDKDFLNNIKFNKESFSKDDLLKVKLRVEEFNNTEKNKLTKEYFIEKVLHHKKAYDNEEKYFDFKE